MVYTDDCAPTPTVKFVGAVVNNCMPVPTVTAIVMVVPAVSVIVTFVRPPPPP